MPLGSFANASLTKRDAAQISRHVGDKVEPEVVENMRSWLHSGFSVDQSVYLPAGDRTEIERLVGYMTRCPAPLFSFVPPAVQGQRDRAGDLPGREGRLPGVSRAAG